MIYYSGCELVQLGIFIRPKLILTELLAFILPKYGNFESKWRHLCPMDTFSSLDLFTMKVDDELEYKLGTGKIQQY